MSFIEDLKAYDDMPSLPGINLTRIDISQNHINSNSKHDLIKINMSYLVLINDVWYLGCFTKQWYGWNFVNWGRTGIQLSSIQKVYETDLRSPEVPHDWDDD